MQDVKDKSVQWTDCGTVIVNVLNSTKWANIEVQQK